MDNHTLMRDRQDRAAMDERVQGEARIAAAILAQHPDVTRADALRAAAIIYARDVANGRRPA